MAGPHLSHNALQGKGLRYFSEPRMSAVPIPGSGQRAGISGKPATRSCIPPVGLGQIARGEECRLDSFRVPAENGWCPVSQSGQQSPRTGIWTDASAPIANDGLAGLGIDSRDLRRGASARGLYLCQRRAQALLSAGASRFWGCRLLCRKDRQRSLSICTWRTRCPPGMLCPAPQADRPKAIAAVFAACLPRGGRQFTALEHRQRARSVAGDRCGAGGSGFRRDRRAHRAQRSPQSVREPAAARSAGCELHAADLMRPRAGTPHARICLSHFARIRAGCCRAMKVRRQPSATLCCVCTSCVTRSCVLSVSGGNHVESFQNGNSRIDRPVLRRQPGFRLRQQLRRLWRLRWMVRRLRLSVLVRGAGGFGVRCAGADDCSGTRPRSGACTGATSGGASRQRVSQLFFRSGYAGDSGPGKSGACVPGAGGAPDEFAASQRVPG